MYGGFEVCYVILDVQSYFVDVKCMCSFIRNRNFVGDYVGIFNCFDFVYIIFVNVSIKEVKK